LVDTPLPTVLFKSLYLGQLIIGIEAENLPR
jgi:hypothetical protein